MYNLGLACEDKPNQAAFGLAVIANEKQREEREA